MTGRTTAHFRRGAAMTEVAVCLPMLSFMLVATIDFARAYRDFVTVTDRARAGALYASQNVGTPGAPATDLVWQTGTQAAALADLGDLRNDQGTTKPTNQVVIMPDRLSAISTNDPINPPSVSITVSSPFQKIALFPGIPHSFTITQTFKMRLQPTAYRMK